MAVGLGSCSALTGQLQEQTLFQASLVHVQYFLRDQSTSLLYFVVCYESSRSTSPQQTGSSAVTVLEWMQCSMQVKTERKAVSKQWEELAVHQRQDKE